MIKTIFAVIRAFEIIGEASKNLPLNVKSKYPQTEWKKIAGFRDKLIHNYFGVDIEIVFNAIKIDIPKFKPVILEIKENSDK
jgi:uncharacterized protein with HEPN domain